LKQNTPVSVNADRLGYAGAGGAATFTGNASLVQGETSIRADELRLDQSKGDLLASGSARASLILGGKSSLGNSDLIRYEDATHVVSYEARRPAARGRGTGRATGPAAAPTPARGAPIAAGPTQAYVKGPQGELRAWRIEMVLSADAGKAERLEAYDDVNLRVEMKRATGERLTYFAEDERYVMTGTAVAPVCVVDPNRASTGKHVGILPSVR
jgi:lipopolysaccharide export system protein LptA